MLKIPAQIVKYTLLVLVYSYRILLSPIMPPACRYMPSCSEYAAEALHKHGIWRGLMLAVKRLMRCNPWGKSGYDPVPEPCNHNICSLSQSSNHRCLL